MPHRTALLLFLAFSFLGNGFSSAQPADPDAPATENVEVSVLDSIEAEYRELVCSRAADPTSKLQMRSIELALEFDYSDSRFDKTIRDTLKKVSQPDNWDVEKVGHAVRLLPLSTLSEVERTELVFQCYLAIGDSRADRDLQRKLKTYLNDAPDRTSRLVHQRLLGGDRSRNLLELTTIPGSSTEATLPLLMQTAKIDESETANWAMSLIPNVIANLKARERKKVEQRERQKLGMAGPEKKFVLYAERIISRYDTNKDQRLVADEYKSMLMSPAAADLDQDGSITVNEYAAWMQSRTKK